MLLERIMAVMETKGFRVFQTDTKEFNLNLVGVRSPSPVPNKFDDRFFVFWKQAGEWHSREYPITTDPGSYWLLHPLNVQGTAILTEGQHPKMWGIGMHRGAYEALVQVSPVTVLRDTNKDNRLDFGTAKTERGLFGINLHHAGAVGRTATVDKWSAGCQVFADIGHFNEFMSMARKAAANWGNSFTYTLLNQGDIDNA